MIEINLSLCPAGQVGITFVALGGILTECWPLKVKNNDFVIKYCTLEIEKWEYDFWKACEKVAWESVLRFLIRPIVPEKISLDVSRANSGSSSGTQTVDNTALHGTIYIYSSTPKAEPLSATLAQRWYSIASMSSVYWANTYNPMLDHRHRRWPNMERTLADCLLFAG